MFKRQTNTLLAGTALLSAALLAPTSVYAKDVVMAYSGSLKDPAMVCGIQTVAKEIAELLGGEVEVHVGGTGFAEPKKLYAQLQRGITDITVTPLAYSPGRFPMSEIIGLPYIGMDNNAVTTAANQLLKEYLADEFAGTHPLAIMALPNYQIHLKDEVTDIATGLKGKRLRAVGKGLSATLRGLGADVVGLPIFQVYENMSKGVIDGFVLPNVPLAAFKLHEVSDHHVQANIGSPVVYMGLSKKFFNSLTAEQQKTIDAKYSGVDAALRYVECFNKGNAGSIGLAKKKGDQFRDITAAEISAIETITKPIIEEYVSSVEAAGKPARAFHDVLVKTVQSLNN